MRNNTMMYMSTIMAGEALKVISPGQILTGEDVRIIPLSNNLGMNTFAPDKNATDLRIDTSREFIVVKGDDGSVPVGDIVTLHRDDRTDNPYFKNKRTGAEGLILHWSNLAYAPEMPEGSYIVNGSEERKILAAIGEVRAISNSRNHEEMGGWFTVKQLKSFGLTEKPPAPPVKEMTVAEVSALVGQEVKIVDKK